MRWGRQSPIDVVQESTEDQQGSDRTHKPVSEVIFINVEGKIGDNPEK